MSKPTEEEKRICSPYCSIVTTPMLPSTVTMTCGWMHLLPPQPPAPSPHPPLTSTNAEAKTWGYFLNPDTRQIELPGKRIRGQICLLIQKRLPRRGIHKLECLTPIIPRVGVGGGGWTPVKQNWGLSGFLQGGFSFFKSDNFSQVSGDLFILETRKAFIVLSLWQKPHDTGNCEKPIK